MRIALDRTALPIPAEVEAFLAAVHGMHRTRTERIREQMKQLTEALNGEGVTPLWLKGAVELLAPDGRASDRMMHDLDLWLPAPMDLTVALAVLDRLGYRVMHGAKDADWTDSHHYAGRANDDWPVRVEVHRHVIARDLASLLPDRDARDGALWWDWDGLEVGCLGPRHRLLHALVQCTVMAVPRVPMAGAPLMKSLDVVKRVAADFAGTLPRDLLPDLTRPAWGDSVPALLTMTEALFGLPSPSGMPPPWWKAWNPSPFGHEKRRLRRAALFRVIKSVDISACPSE